jgi:hypothetical protein
MKRLKTLKAKIPVNKAGGGLVYNKMERYYSFSGTENGFIRRNRKGEDIEGHINAGRGGNGCQSTPHYTKTSKNLPRFQAQRCLQTKITLV